MKMKTSDIVVMLILVVVGGASTQTCPEKCDCKKDQEGTIVNCENQNFVSLPDQFPNDTISIDVRNNNIQELDMTKLEGLSNLRILDASNNVVDSVTMGESASFSKLQTLFLSNNRISALPKEFLQNFPSLSVLRLDNNRLPALNGGMFSTLNLTECKLSQNSISTLTGAAFRDAMISYIDLSNNNISSIEAGTFQELKGSLHTLIMAQTNIVGDLPENIFQDIEFEKIDLQSARIVNLAFLNHTKTKELDLSDNAFNPLDLKTCTGLNTVKKLRLRRLNLNQIPDDFFRGMQTLEVLDLTNNKLSFLDDAPFSSLALLKELILTNNQLGLLPDDFCQGLTNLRRLMLSMNQLEALSLSSFHGCQGLETLSVTNNRIQVLDESFEALINRTQQLHLEMNPFHCNCETKWLVKWIHDHPTVFIGMLNCQTPYMMPMAMMLVDDFVCKSPNITYISENVTSVTGSDVTLSCTAEGDPAPEVEWTSQSSSDSVATGPPTDRANYKTRAYWKIHAVKKEMGGEYRCTATNAAGTVSKSTYLNVEAVTATVAPTLKMSTSGGAGEMTSSTGRLLQTGAMSTTESSTKGVNVTPLVSKESVVSTATTLPVRTTDADGMTTRESTKTMITEAGRTSKAPEVAETTQNSFSSRNPGQTTRVLHNSHPTSHSDTTVVMATKKLTSQPHIETNITQRAGEMTSVTTSAAGDSTTSGSRDSSSSQPTDGTFVAASTDSTDAPGPVAGRQVGLSDQDMVIVVATIGGISMVALVVVVIVLVVLSRRHSNYGVNKTTESKA